MNSIFSRARRDDRGVVSMIIVIFSALLMSLIVVGFMAIMTKNQQQATNDDLSKSAYDSAMAGVEDGKRALAYCIADMTRPGCNSLDSGECNTLETIRVAARTSGLNQEYQLERTLSSNGSNTLDQAYTCVTINPSPDEYQAEISRDQPLLIPLRGQSRVSQLQFSWSPFPERDVNFPSVNGGLLPLSQWNEEAYPPIMRAQLIRLGSGGEVNLDDLDDDASSTVFLYPVESGLEEVDFASDVRHRDKGIPFPAACSDSVCSVTMDHGDGPISEPNRPSYLLLTPLYSGASIRLQLQNSSGTPIGFTDTQAIIDSTGRANSLFRRVSARVDLIPRPVYPTAALSLTGPLCKNFIVASGTIDPTICLEP